MGTYEPSEKLRKLQLCMLEILDEVVRICDKHNIKYFLVGGSALGAYRHKGFIPWDDDIDIAILRVDYEKFSRICEHELNEKFFHQTPFTDLEYPWLFSKMRLNHTFAEESSLIKENVHHGISIDIFPVDYAPIIGYGVARCVYKILDSLCSVHKNRAMDTVEPKARIVVKVARIVPRQYYYKVRKIFLKLNNKFNRKSVLLYNFGSPLAKSKKIRYKTEWFTEGDCFLEFEDKKYRVPNAVEELLELCYGESYMQIPPQNKIKPHFSLDDVLFDTEKKRGK